MTDAEKRDASLRVKCCGNCHYFVDGSYVVTENFCCNPESPAYHSYVHPTRNLCDLHERRTNDT